jgi:hypothetical protein
VRVCEVYCLVWLADNLHYGYDYIGPFTDVTGYAGKMATRVHSRHRITRRWLAHYVWDVRELIQVESCPFMIGGSCFFWSNCSHSPE